MSKNLSELAGRKGVDTNLFEELGIASQADGTPSKEELQKLADEFLVGLSNTYGTATFYDFMKPENKGKKAYVCNGTACVCSGKQDEVTKALSDHFKTEEIGHMTCLGRCHENGAFHYNGKNYSAKNTNEIAAILSNSGDENNDNYNVAALGKEILTAPFTSVDDYYANLKTILSAGRVKALDEIKASNIRGRGGAGFPMGFKLESCMNTDADQKFIICNADEGDPGAYSDRYLLEERPHSVLYGMMIAGFITGANWGLLYIRAEYPEAVEIVQTAIDNLRSKGLLGDDILGSGFNYNFKIIKAQGAYICGEETALINSIEGQRPEVRTRPPYPTQQGLFNKPTIVNNVETLAAVHWIISNGGSQYKALGTEESSGTKLVSLDSFFKNPGIYEVEMGTPLSTVVNDLGGGFTQDVKAMQIGGPLGGLVPTSKINDLNLDFESFANAGFLLGHASIVCVPSSFPMIKFIEHLFDFAAFESCGKCFPCRLGTKRGHEMFKNAMEGNSKLNKELVNDLLHTLETGSLCAHGGGIPLPVENALTYFEDELKPFFN
jgi:NADH-quinone oxidoreductase subunit F